MAKEIIPPPDPLLGSAVKAPLESQTTFFAPGGQERELNSNAAYKEYGSPSLNFDSFFENKIKPIDIQLTDQPIDMDSEEERYIKDKKAKAQERIFSTFGKYKEKRKLDNVDLSKYESYNDLQNSYNNAKDEVYADVSQDMHYQRHLFNANKDVKEYRRFHEYFDKREKARFNSQSEWLQRAEIEQGGINFDTGNLKTLAFMDSFSEQATFGFYDGSHSVYGKSHRIYNPVPAALGAASGMALSTMSVMAGLG